MAGLNRFSELQIASLMRQSAARKNAEAAKLAAASATRRFHYAEAAANRALAPSRTTSVAMQQTLDYVNKFGAERSEIDLHKPKLPNIELPQNPKDQKAILNRFLADQNRDSTARMAALKTQFMSAISDVRARLANAAALGMKQPKSAAADVNAAQVAYQRAWSLGRQLFPLRMGRAPTAAESVLLVQPKPLFVKVADTSKYAGTQRTGMMQKPYTLDGFAGGAEDVNALVMALQQNTDLIAAALSVQDKDFEKSIDQQTLPKLKLSTGPSKSTIFKLAAVGAGVVLLYKLNLL